MADLNATFPKHYYPDYICQDSFTNRRVQLIVKVNETLGGNADELQKMLDKMHSDVEKVLGQNGNIWGKTAAEPTDITTSQIKENTKRLQNAVPIYSVVLPLPNELSDVQNHAWETETGILSSGINGLLKDATAAATPKSNDKAMTSALEAAKGFEKNVLGAAAAVVNKANAVVGAVVGSAGKVVANASSAFGFRKPLVDPGFFANYNGTRPRIFNMSFDFLPNNDEEANNILNIIINLKKFSLPTTAVSGVMLMAPYTFEIVFGNERLERLINLSNVALQNLEVNYSADGQMQMFGNGMPKYIRISMQFLECNVVTSEFY